MKIAVISDIHGNMQALNAVLADINSENCSKIFCLGDLAMAGPEPEKAIAKIKELYENSQLELIQGNTDNMIANYTEFGDLVKSKFPVMGNALGNDVSSISDELIDFLKNLPKQKILMVENVKVHLVHGSPRRNDENILPEMPLNEIEEMILDTDADLIFCGHTHIPCGYQTTKKQTVVNAGSVGRPFTDNPQACYVIVNFNDKAFDIKHKFIDYDNITASNILLNRNFEGSDKLANTLLKPELRHF